MDGTIFPLRIHRIPRVPWQVAVASCVADLMVRILGAFAFLRVTISNLVPTLAAFGARENCNRTESAMYSVPSRSTARPAGRQKLGIGLQVRRHRRKLRAGWRQFRY